MVPGPTKIWEPVYQSPGESPRGDGARMDLRASSNFLLMPQMGVQPIPVQLPTPLPQGTVGLLLGRGSLTLQGLIVHPGIIDNQHTPEIQVLCSSPKGVFSISKGDRISQLLLLPSTYQEPRSKQMGSSGWDSTYLVVSLQDRPKLLLQVNGKSFEGILDTGADKSIISSHWWPRSWPITKASHSLLICLRIFFSSFFSSFCRIGLLSLSRHFAN